ncbi:hypothetical protein FB192DRAFT_1079305 [Mucor lusitanicus]|uniref:Secreted protein n=1 Tax=Mucor circinelloides f. lusitanicus TaxID=29924 RepID=A0A8H4BLD7_MUCCL|nr:hypothetical protein FB192DRAFT_1079305 [Mucor lusitanicus]
MATVIALIRLSLMVVSANVRPAKRVVQHDGLRDALCKHLVLGNGLLFLSIASLAVDFDDCNRSSGIDDNTNRDADANQGRLGQAAAAGTIGIAAV